MSLHQAEPGFPILTQNDRTLVTAMTENGVPKGTVVKVFQALVKGRKAEAIRRAEDRADMQARDTLNALSDFLEPPAGQRGLMDVA